jgi:hypothetical protein
VPGPSLGEALSEVRLDQDFSNGCRLLDGGVRRYTSGNPPAYDLGSLSLLRVPVGMRVKDQLHP